MQYLLQLFHRCHSYNNYFLMEIKISELTKVVENINMNPTTRQFLDIYGKNYFLECFLSVISVIHGLNKK